MQSAARLQCLCEGSFCLEKASLYWAHWLTDCLFFYRLYFHNPAHSVGPVRHLARSCPRGCDLSCDGSRSDSPGCKALQEPQPRWHLQPRVNTQMLVAPLCKTHLLLLLLRCVLWGFCSVSLFPLESLDLVTFQFYCTESKSENKLSCGRKEGVCTIPIPWWQVH